MSKIILNSKVVWSKITLWKVITWISIIAATVAIAFLTKDSSFVANALLLVFVVLMIKLSLKFKNRQTKAIAKKLAYWALIINIAAVVAYGAAQTGESNLFTMATVMAAFVVDGLVIYLFISAGTIVRFKTSLIAKLKVFFEKKKFQNLKALVTMNYFKRFVIAKPSLA